MSLGFPYEAVAVLAIGLDAWIGDPKWLPHPVVGIGKCIALLQKWLLVPHAKPLGQRLGGILLALVTVGISGGAMYGILQVASALSIWLAVLLQVVLIATTLAQKGLVQAGREVYQALQLSDLTEARKRVGWIVGRDTEKLAEPEIVRATVETVAENLTDAIVAPLFYAVLGGAPLAMMYRAVNTLDSMVGYRNERYLYFGWASARLDDGLNFIPARLTGLLLLLALLIMRLLPAYRKQLQISQAFKTWRSDASKHPSPNSGIPESIVAGALGIQLGGINYYGGVASHRATMGTKKREMRASDILLTSRIIQMVTLLIAILLLLLWRVSAK